MRKSVGRAFLSESGFIGLLGFSGLPFAQIRAFAIIRIWTIACRAKTSAPQES